MSLRGDRRRVHRLRRPSWAWRTYDVHSRSRLFWATTSSTPSENMPWYHGSTLLHHLEHVNVGANRNMVDFRFPVQYVIRPDQDYRGLRGPRGVRRHPPGRGDHGTCRPSKTDDRSPRSTRSMGPVEEANGRATRSRSRPRRSSTSVPWRHDRPAAATCPNGGVREIDATICWTSEEPMQPGKQYWLRHDDPRGEGVRQRGSFTVSTSTTLHRDEVELLRAQRHRAGPHHDGVADLLRSVRDEP